MIRDDLKRLIYELLEEEFQLWDQSIFSTIYLVQFNVGAQSLIVHTLLTHRWVWPKLAKSTPPAFCPMGRITSLMIYQFNQIISLIIVAEKWVTDEHLSS